MHKLAAVLAVCITISALPAFSQQTAPATTTTTPAKKAAAPAAKSAKAPAGKAATAKTPAAAPALTTTTQKFSYAVGMNVGNTLRQQSLEVDPNLVLRGLKDVLANSKTALTEQEARAVLMQVRADLQKKQMEKMQALNSENKKTGDAFLAANKSKAGVVALPSGLQYKILKEGTGPKPAATDTVVCNYKGTLLDGKEFDSSSKHGQPATFLVSGVIKGWTEALQLMPVGSTWQLFIPSDLAYGDRGAGADVAPGSTLVFEVELLSIQPKEAPAADKSAPVTDQPKVEAKPDAKPADVKPQDAKPPQQN